MAGSSAAESEELKEFPPIGAGDLDNAKIGKVLKLAAEGRNAYERKNKANPLLKPTMKDAAICTALWLAVATVGALAGGWLGLFTGVIGAVISISIMSFIMTILHQPVETSEHNLVEVRRGWLTDVTLGMSDRAIVRSWTAVERLVAPEKFGIGWLKNTLAFLGLPVVAFLRVWEVAGDASETKVEGKWREVDSPWPSKIVKDSRTKGYANLWDEIQDMNEDVRHGLNIIIWLLQDMLEAREEGKPVPENEQREEAVLREQYETGKLLVEGLRRDIRLAARFLGLGPLGSHTKSLEEYARALSHLRQRSQERRKLMRKIHQDGQSAIRAVDEIEALKKED